MYLHLNSSYGGIIVTPSFSPLPYGNVTSSKESPYNYLDFIGHPITYKIRELWTDYYGEIENVQGSGAPLGTYNDVYLKPPGTLRGLIGAYNEKLPVVALNWMPFDKMWDGDFLLMLENTLKWFSTDWP